MQHVNEYLKKRQQHVQLKLRSVHTSTERNELAVELEDLVHAVASFKHCRTEEQINDAMLLYPNIFEGHSLDTFDFTL